jgi:hypothetical protein
MTVGTPDALVDDRRADYAARFIHPSDKGGWG